MEENQNCPKCGNSLADNACLRCGYNGAARQLYVETNTHDGEVNKGNIVGLIIVIIGAIAALTGLIIFIVSRFK